MGVTRENVAFRDDFFGARSYTSGTPEGGTGLTFTKHTGAGSPTCASVTPVATGQIKLLLTNTSEAQGVYFDWNDKLGLTPAKLRLVQFHIAIGALDANTSFVCGIASARNTTKDSVTTNAWFRCDGGASSPWAINVESDDSSGGRDNDDKSTGQTMATDVFKRLEINFGNGPSDVRFYMDGARVASSTTFNISTDATAGVQPYIELAKASGTGVGYVTIDYIEILTRT